MLTSFLCKSKVAFCYLELLLIICNLLSGAAWFMWAASPYVGMLRVILVACYLRLLDLSEGLHVIWGLLIIVWVVCCLELLGLCEWLYIIWGCFIFFDWPVTWNSLTCLGGIILLGDGLFYLSGFLLELLHLIWSSLSYLELHHTCLIRVLLELVNVRGFVLSGASSYLSELPIIGADWFAWLHVIWSCFILSEWPTFPAGPLSVGTAWASVSHIQSTVFL